MIKPIGSKILIHLKDTAKDKVGSILLATPDTDEEIFVVEGIGNSVEDIEVGMTVIVDKYASLHLTCEKNKAIVDESAVIAIIEDV